MADGLAATRRRVFEPQRRVIAVANVETRSAPEYLRVAANKRKKPGAGDRGLRSPRRGLLGCQSFSEKGGSA